MYDVTQSTQHDFCQLQQVVHHFRFLRSRLNGSTSKLTYPSFLFYWPIRFCPANQLFLVYGDASCSICQPSPRGPDKTPFCRGRLLHVDEDATLLSMLRVALGDNHDNESLISTRLSPETWQRWRRPAPCLFCLIIEHDQAELEPKKLETADSSSLHLASAQHTRAARMTLATTFFRQ